MKLMLYATLMLMLLSFGCISNAVDSKNPMTQESKVDVDKELFEIVKYEKDMPIFIDRPYKDQALDPRLEDLYLIQMPRHVSPYIVLEISRPITVYRLRPDNSKNYFKDWELSSIRALVIGAASFQNTIVKKNFPPGNYLISPGGSTTCPLFFKFKADNQFPLPVDQDSVKTYIKAYPSVNSFWQILQGGLSESQ